LCIDAHFRDNENDEYHSEIIPQGIFTGKQAETFLSLQVEVYFSKRLKYHDKLPMEIKEYIARAILDETALAVGRIKND